MDPVRRVAVRARLDDSTKALERAKADAAAGDEDWERWIEEHERGEAMVLLLEVTVEVEAEHVPPIVVHNGGVWAESDPHIPKLERQIAETVTKDIPTIVRELRRYGCDVDAGEFDDMYVHVELADDVLAHVRREGGRPRTSGSLPDVEWGRSKTL